MRFAITLVNALRNPLVDALCDTLADALCDTLVDALCDALMDPLCDALLDALCDALMDALRDTLFDALGNALMDALCNPLLDALCDPLVDALCHPFMDTFRDFVFRAMRRLGRAPDLHNQSVRAGLSGAGVGLFRCERFKGRYPRCGRCNCRPYGDGYQRRSEKSHEAKDTHDWTHLT